MMKKTVLAAAALGLVAVMSASAGPIRDRLKARSAQGSAATKPSEFAKKAIHVSYGPSDKQTFDLYLPENPQDAPILIMVHGGAWLLGDAAASRVVDNKLRYWGGKGYIFVSVNYRLMPEADPFLQAQDVARALSKVQSVASRYRGNPDRVILMGHSAGAHLVALLSSDPAIAVAQGATRWRGTVVLDSGALDVPAIMNRKHMAFYDQVFGGKQAFWTKTSPAHAVKPDAVPMLLICSLRRKDASCDQARAFQSRVKALGQDAPVSPEDLTHSEVNENLGLPNAYTERVNAFIAARLK